VRIAITVAAPGHSSGILEKVTSEQARDDGENEVTLSRSGGVLAANLQIGADLGSAVALASNDKVAGMGVALHGAGFIVQPEEAEAFRASGPQAIKAYLGGADLLRNPRERYLIDFSFMTESEAFDRVTNRICPPKFSFMAVSGVLPVTTRPKSPRINLCHSPAIPHALPIRVHPFYRPKGAKFVSPGQRPGSGVGKNPEP